MAEKVVIVGGVAGGASTAARLRRLDEAIEIILLERGEHISYATCGLPYYIGAVITNRAKLLVMTENRFRDWFNVDVRVFNEAISIDRAQQELKIKNQLNGKVYTESYDYLVLSPGAAPIRPPLPGIDHPCIFTLRSVPDSDRVYDYISNTNPSSAVIVGGGFIGLEMVENLKNRGIKVTLVELANQVLPFLDPDIAVLVHQHIRENGITLYLSDGVKAFEKTSEKKVSVYLQSGRRIETEFVLLAIGVKPEIKLAQEAGLAVGKGIQVNEYLQTSDPKIYAIGDAIEVKEFITGLPATIPLAGPANKQGRIVANNIKGRSEKYLGTQGTSVLKVFDLIVSGTGSSERFLREAGLNYHYCTIHPGSHAGYYPGSNPMTLKLLFSPEGAIYGAQAVGISGVDKRIDVLATLLRCRKKVCDLQNLELNYAPPFSSAKDPVNMAGYVASNILRGDLKILTVNELLETDQDQLQLLDLRDPEELEKDGSIPGSINIPLAELRRRIDELQFDKEIITYCSVGIRSYIAYRILTQRGFNKVRNLNGGYRSYQTIKREQREKETL